MSREVIEAMMYPVLKYPKKKDNSGDLDYDRFPTLKVKVPYWEGVFNMEVYDTNKQPVYLPPKKNMEATSSETPFTLVTKGSKITGLITCTGLWFSAGRWGMTWKIPQCCVTPRVGLVGSGKCFIQSDSEDEDEEEETTKVEDNTPAFLDSDSDASSVTQDVKEEVEQEVVKEVKEVAATKPKKKKRVVKSKGKKKKKTTVSDE